MKTKMTAQTKGSSVGKVIKQLDQDEMCGWTITKDSGHIYIIIDGLMKTVQCPLADALCYMLEALKSKNRKVLRFGFSPSRSLAARMTV